MRAADLTTEHTDVDGCRIAFHDVGRANHRTLVFLHGIGCSKAVWGPVLERLPSDWRLLAVDLRGAGESAESVRRQLSLELWSSDLRALLRNLDVPDQPVIVGHSLGASVALQFGLTYDVAGALVLIGAEAGLNRLGPMMRERAKAISETGIEEWVGGPWRKAPPFSEASREADPDLVDWYAQMLHQTGAERYLRAVEAIAESPDLTALVEQIVVPCLVLIGSEDDRTLPSFGWDLANRLPNGRGVEIADVGHTLSLEAPVQVADELVAFVEAAGLD